MSYSITTTPEFSKEIKRLVKKYPSLKSEYIQLLHSLLNEPFQGTSLGNNIFKIRLSVKSKSTGKRGGARVITFVRVLENEILLISIYDKADQGNMTSKEINERIKKIYSDFFDKNLKHYILLLRYLLKKFAHAFFQKLSFPGKILPHNFCYAFCIDWIFFGNSFAT